MAASSEAPRDGLRLTDQLSSPGLTLQSDQETPAHNAGSFSYDDNLSRWPRRMPTDETTGMPYALLPIEFPSTVTWGVDNETTNYHHHFFNRRHPDLEGDLKINGDLLSRPEDIPLPVLAGLAVRMSRGQILPKEQHAMMHREYPIGPVLPHTTDEKFMVVAKACMGIVSRFALDVTSPSADKLVYMDDDTFARVAHPKLLCTERLYYDRPADYRRRVIGGFLLKYAVNRDLSDIIPRKTIEIFLSPRSEEERIATGNFIIKEAMEARIAPVIPIYRDLKRQGMVQPGKADARTALWKYIHPERRSKVFRVLDKRLKQIAA